MDRSSKHPLPDQPFQLREYQRAAAGVFHAGGVERGGSGVVVLPCGAGKTIVGMAAMALVRASTLILTTSVTAARQWKAELLDKTSLRRDVRFLTPTTVEFNGGKLSPAQRHRLQAAGVFITTSRGE